MLIKKKMFSIKHFFSCDVTYFYCCNDEILLHKINEINEYLLLIWKICLIDTITHTIMRSKIKRFRLKEGRYVHIHIYINYNSI